MLQYSPNSDFQWFLVQHSSRAEIHFWPPQRCKAQGPLQQSPGQQKEPPALSLSPGWQDTVLRVPGQSWPWGTWGTLWHTLHAHTCPGMSWHILAAPTGPWTLWQQFDHPGPSWHHHPGAAPTLENTVLKEDGLSCIVGSQSSHFGVNVCFGWNVMKCHFSGKNVIFGFFGNIPPGPTLATKCHRLRMPGKLATRSSQKKSHNYQILCSHILYCTKTHSWHISYINEQHEMSTVFSGGTSLHWAKMTEMQYFVQNWVKRQERLRSITRNIGIGPCSHWLLQNTNNWQRRPETEMQGGRPISEKRENKNKMYTGCWPAGLVCVAPCRKCYKTERTFTFTRTGPQASTRSLPHGEPPSTGTSVALLDCKRKAIHTDIHSKAFKAFRPGSHCSQWLLSKSYKIYKIYKTAVSLWENRSDLVEIFTQKAQLLTFTQKSLKCSHMHKITQNP